MKPSLVERTAAIGAQARSANDARGSTKPDPGAVKPGDASPQQPRDWWTIHHWGGSVVEVLVTPPQTQRAMRDFYPHAGGIIATE